MRSPRAMGFWQREVRALAREVGKPTEAEIVRALELLQEQRPHQYQVLVLSADHTQAAIAVILGIKDRSCVSRRLATARESFAGYLRAVLAQRG